MKINKNLKPRGKRLNIEPCPESYFDKFLNKILGLERIEKDKPWEYEDLLVSSFLKLDSNTYHDIDVDFKDNIFSAGVNKKIIDRLGFTYLQCWVKSSQFSPKLCIYIYYDGTSLRGFVPFMGNPINYKSKHLHPLSYDHVRATIIDRIPEGDISDYNYLLSEIFNKDEGNLKEDISYHNYLLGKVAFNKDEGSLEDIKDIFLKDLLEPDYDLCEEDFKACIVFDWL